MKPIAWILLPTLKGKSVDTVFADPPFNLGKRYGTRCSDYRTEDEYLVWCKRWLQECERVLKPGGALFLYNLPKWNVLLGPHLRDLGLQFRHWIAIERKGRFPIAGRLYPAHYSLLYYTKGQTEAVQQNSDADRTLSALWRRNPRLWRTSKSYEPQRGKPERRLDRHSPSTT